MYPIVNAFWELLKGNITYEDKTIPIVKRLKSKDKTPCITLDIASDMQINRDYRTDKTQRIVLEHPFLLFQAGNGKLLLYDYRSFPGF